MNRITLRHLDTSDARFLARYAAECGGNTEVSEVRRLEERFRRLVKEPDFLGFIALDGARRIGHVQASIWRTRVEISDVYVEEGYRSRGIGSRLLEAFIAEARARGVSAVQLDTESDNAPMRKVAERLGFSLTRFTCHYEKRLSD